MKLDRNINPTGRGKYALVKLRMLKTQFANEIRDALATLGSAGAIDYGNNNDTDFFVIRLRDKYAAPALAAYAMAAYRDDPEWAIEILNLAKKAAEAPNQRSPD